MKNRNVTWSFFNFEQSLETLFTPKHCKLSLGT
jgi:hypothetical protein